MPAVSQRLRNRRHWIAEALSGQVSRRGTTQRVASRARLPPASVASEMLCHENHDLF